MALTGQHEALVGLVGLSAVAQSPFEPASAAALPNLVSAPDVARANALVASTGSAGFLLKPSNWSWKSRHTASAPPATAIPLIGSRIRCASKGRSSPPSPMVRSKTSARRDCSRRSARPTLGAVPRRVILGCRAARTSRAQRISDARPHRTTHAGPRPRPSRPAPPGTPGRDTTTRGRRLRAVAAATRLRPAGAFLQLERDVPPVDPDCRRTLETELTSFSAHLH